MDRGVPNSSQQDIAALQDQQRQMMQMMQDMAVNQSAQMPGGWNIMADPAGMMNSFDPGAMMFGPEMMYGPEMMFGTETMPGPQMMPGPEIMAGSNPAVIMENPGVTVDPGMFNPPEPQDEN